MDVPRRLFTFACTLTVLLAACRPSEPAVRIVPVPARPAVAAAQVGHALAADPSRAAAGLVPASVSRIPSRPILGPASTDDPALSAAIAAALGAEIGHYSVVVKRLRDGRGTRLNAEREYYAASLFKLALLYEAAHERSVGALDFDELVTITARDLDEDLGTIGALGAGIGDRLSVRDAVRAMVTLSDNTSAVMLLYRLGPSTVDRTLRLLGLQDTSVNTRALPTTAADMALLMEALLRGTGLTPSVRDDALAVLANQETRSGIPRGLPHSVRSGNKTGTWPGATHDVAYVDAPGGAYVIAILSDLGWVWEPIARISKAVYEVMGS